MIDYEEQTRPCEICKHYRKDDKGNYSCEKWDCEFEDIKEIREPKGLTAKVGIVGKPSLLNQIIPIREKGTE